MVDTAGKYLTFALHTESYGLEILKVREIIGYMPVTQVPQSLPYIKGVINLRGQVIPVMDLRLIFGMPEAEVTEKTCIIVVNAQRWDGQEKQIGVIVDRVSEVVDIAQEMIESAPDFGGSVDGALILGMAKIESKIVMLLNIERVLFGSECDSESRDAQVA